MRSRAVTTNPDQRRIVEHLGSKMPWDGEFLKCIS